MPVKYASNTLPLLILSLYIGHQKIPVRQKRNAIIVELRRAKKIA